MKTTNLAMIVYTLRTRKSSASCESVSMLFAWRNATSPRVERRANDQSRTAVSKSHKDACRRIPQGTSDFMDRKTAGLRIVSSLEILRCLRKAKNGGREQTMNREIVIKIPEEIYNMVINTGTFGCYRFNTTKAIKNGTPLPKGRLIDADRLIDRVLHLDKNPNGHSKVYDESQIVNIIESEIEKGVEK